MVLILSIMVIAGLTITSIEANTSQNYYMGKKVFYAAEEGVNETIEIIKITPDPTTFDLNKTLSVSNETRTLITGSLFDLENNDPQKISGFTGFTPPPLPAISLSGSIGITPVIWDVPVSAHIKVGNRHAYAEVEAGVYATVVTKND